MRVGRSLRERFRDRRLCWALGVTALSLLTFPVPATASDAPVQTESSADSQSTDNLDPAILATMRQQEALQPALALLYEEQMRSASSGYAGVAFEGSGLTLYWKGELTPGMTATLDLARELCSITVKPAMYSYAELQAEGEKLHRAANRYSGTEIQSIGYRYDGSGLDVERAPAAAVIALSEHLSAKGLAAPVPVEQVLVEAQLTVPVSITVASEPFELLVSRTADTSPWNGGGRWENWHAGVYRISCTTGFGVHSGGHSWILTAAHCASLGDTAWRVERYVGSSNKTALTRWFLVIIRIRTATVGTRCTG